MIDTNTYTYSLNRMIREEVSVNEKFDVLKKGLEELLKAGYSEEIEDFPKDIMKSLKSIGLLKINIPLKYGGMALGSGKDNARMLNILREIGSCDLSAGRIYEGHINALLLIDSYGSHEQKHKYFLEASRGVLFGVWNSELRSEPLKVTNYSDKKILAGGKIFCSGASYIQRPIVTAADLSGKRMIVLHMEDMKLDEDYTYWRPMGMKASVSCRFDFTGIVVNNSQLLGQAEDYEREPDFSGGAARFAAVQLGGAEAAIQVALNHLLKFDRTNDPNQLRRIGELTILQKRGRIWLEKAGSYADNKKIKPDAFIQYANMFRTEARTICEEILRLTELSVGLQGLMAPHPLERIHRDLSVYLKQPGPDRVLEECGRFYIKKISDFDSTPS